MKRTTLLSATKINTWFNGI